MIKTSDDVRELKVVLEDALKPLTREIASEILSKAQENLVNSGHVDRGILLRSGYMRDLDENSVVVGFNALHSQIINYGRHPSEKMPPFEEIKSWVVRNRQKIGVKDPKKIDGVAYAIAKSIQKRGFAGCFYFTNAVDEVLSQYKIK